jgi:hypothetical protein
MVILVKKIYANYIQITMASNMFCSVRYSSGLKKGIM